MSEAIGKVVALRGLMCDVAIWGARPKPKELLSLIGSPEVRLEVASYPDQFTVRCINLSGSNKVRHGSQVTATGVTISVPVGKSVLGRVLNALGEPVDGAGAIEGERRSIYQANGAQGAARQAQVNY